MNAGRNPAREAYARLRSVIHALPEGIVIVDAAGRVEMVNRRAEELAGRTAEEMSRFLDDPPWRLFRPDGTPVAHAERPLVKAIESGEPLLNERLRVVRHDGREFIFNYSATPVHGDDGVDCVVLTFQDVTEEESRERAERDFITNAAHELQTPLAAITSAVEVLQSGAKERPDDRDRFLAHIESACDRFQRLTRALLVLARAQTNAEPPRREVVPVEPLLREIADSFPRQSIDVEVACEPDLGVVANRVLLEQAVANLGQNAVKHTRGRIYLSAVKRDGHVDIVVRDTGPGIDADRARIFERFYRRGDTAGFGLGLAIVAEAVHALDGELGFETSEAGTTFAISLPYARILGP